MAETGVSLEHRDFEAYGESGAKVGGEGGWPAPMNLYRFESAAA